MTDEAPRPPHKGNVIPMLRRMGEAVKLVFGLADTIAQLRIKNEALAREFYDLRRDFDEQAGQVKVLMRFVETALQDRMRAQAEAAVRAILAEHESGARPKESGKKSNKRRAVRQGGSKPRRSGRS